MSETLLRSFAKIWPVNSTIIITIIIIIIIIIIITIIIIIIITIIITFISIVQIQQFSFQMRLTTSTLQDMYRSKIWNVYKNIKKSKD